MGVLPWFRWLSKPCHPQPMRLQDLPDDVLSHIIVTVMNPVTVGANARMVEQSYRAALPLSLTCRKLHTLFQAELVDCELWQSGRIDDIGLAAIARNANTHVRRMILRKCSRISVYGLQALATHCSNVRTIDLSYMDITDDELGMVIRGTAGSLRSLLVRGCAKLTDRSLVVIGRVCKMLEAVDICGLPLISDEGIEEMARGVGERLTMIVCSECPGLTDCALESFGKWCGQLEVVTCRALGGITNGGLDALCRGLGEKLAILDILDCDEVKVRGFLDSARKYCPQLARRYERAEGRSLRQMIISSLSGFIFHVTGSDIHNGKSAVYFLLVDSGTCNSFRVSIGSSSLDLTKYGSILASCFGEAPNDQVKQTLLTLYGLDLDAEESESEREA